MTTAGRLVRGDVLGGRFELIEPVATGGMSSVYSGRDAVTGEYVAVKVLGPSEDGGERFLREAELLARLDHPHIVRHVSHGIEGQVSYLVTEWVDGTTLHALMLEQGFTLSESVELLTQVAEVVGVFHAIGLIHRDLKPSNLMFESGDLTRLKLIDFGIARFADDVQRLTGTGFAIGTPGFMAPEQALGRTRLDARVDVFALGCIFYLLATGRRPFSTSDVGVAHLRILLEEPPPIALACPEIPPAAAALAACMLQKEPDRRPADGAAVARALRDLGPMPEGPRRRWGRTRAGDSSEETVVAAKRPMSATSAAGVGILLLGVRDEDDDTRLLKDGFAELLAPLEIVAISTTEQFAAVIVRLDRSVVEITHELAAAALRLRARTREVPIVIALQNESSDALGWAAHAVNRESYARMFGQHPAELAQAIELPRELIEFVGERYHVEAHQQRYYLR